MGGADLRCGSSHQPSSNEQDRDKIGIRALVVWLLLEMHHRLDSSAGKPVDPFDGG